MKLIVDDEGLGFEAKLDIENSPKARDFYSAIKRGDIDKMSFMFVIEKDEWTDLDSEKPTRRIMDISVVFELSGVTFPAYESTEISARDKEALESAKATLESVRRQALESVEAELELEKAKLRNKFF
jgi:HK97 family phage prohead protease